MKFDSIFELQKILKKIGFSDFLLKTKEIPDNLEKEQKALILAEIAAEFIINNLSDVREEIYIFLNKETEFKIEELKIMDFNEVFSLLQDIFKNGIPQIIIDQFKKKM